jgi:DNA-binding MarR family transcriptional regulator
VVAPVCRAAYIRSLPCREDRSDVAAETYNLSPVLGVGMSHERQGTKPPQGRSPGRSPRQQDEQHVVGPGGSSPTSVSATPTRKPLSGRWLSLLRSGDTSSYGGDRSRAAMALATAYVNANIPRHEFIEALANQQNQASRWYSQDRRGRPRDARPRILRDWDRAVARVSAQPAIESKAEAIQEVGLYRAKAAEAQWPGRTGPTDRAVLRGVHAVATKVGAVEIRLSVREAAEMSGVDKSTAARALNRLVKAGWLRRTDEATVASRMPAKYRLSAPKGGAPNPVVPAVPTSAAVESDTWRMLGRHQAHVYDALHEQPQSVRDLVDATGRVRSTVSKALDSLAKDNLAREARPGRWVRGPADPAGLAEKYGQVGRAEAQRAAHKRQREMQLVQFKQHAEAEFERYLDQRRLATTAA